MGSEKHLLKDSGTGALARGRPSGFDLFLRFAEGCRHYLEDKRAISREDSQEIRLYLENRGIKPSGDVLRRVYYVAYPGLEGVRARMKRESIFERDVVREFYAFDHNRMKFEQGNLICIAYPARVRDVRALKGGTQRHAPGPRSSVMIELEPVTGMFRVDTELPLRKGDWVMMHRMMIIEKIDKVLANRVITYLRKLGLDKSRVFPRKAYKYLTDLKFSSTRRV
jgi:hydrogenase maturation factor